MSMSGDDHISRGGVVTARCIEVFTGAGRRREWSADQKATIIAESYAGESSVLRGGMIRSNRAPVLRPQAVGLSRK